MPVKRLSSSSFFKRLMDEKPATENRAAHIMFLRAAVAAEKSEKAAKQAAISAAQAMIALSAAEKSLPEKGQGLSAQAFTEKDDGGLTRDDLGVCLSAVTLAMDNARNLQSHVLSLCGGDLSAPPYRRATEAEQRIADLRRKLILELETRGQLERGDADAF